MNASEFMNEMGRQVELLRGTENERLIDLIMVKSSQLIGDGLWRFYNTEEGVKRCLDIYLNYYNNISGASK